MSIKVSNEIVAAQKGTYCSPLEVCSQYVEPGAAARVQLRFKDEIFDVEAADLLLAIDHATNLNQRSGGVR